METNTEDAIQFATTFSTAAPDDYKKEAFQVALQYYLNKSETGKDNKPQNTKKITTQKIQRKENNLEKIFQEEYDWSITQITQLQPLGQYLLLLKIVRDEFNIGILSTDEIKEILNEKFRINKTANAISMSLMAGVGKYVDRVKRGNEYGYRITKKGETHLDKLIKK